MTPVASSATGRPGPQRTASARRRAANSAAWAIQAPGRVNDAAD